VPELYLLIIISSVLVPGFFVLLGILLLFSWVSLVGLCARRIPARAQFRICPGGARARRVQHRHHVPPSVAQRHGGDADLPAVHHVNSSVMTLTALDFLGFGLPPGSPSLGELLSQGKANLQAPWLGSPASSPSR
jgi:microcin C transport system permease protein